MPGLFVSAYSFRIQLVTGSLPIRFLRRKGYIGQAWIFQIKIKSKLTLNFEFLLKYLCFFSNLRNLNFCISQKILSSFYYSNWDKVGVTTIVDSSWYINLKYGVERQKAASASPSSSKNPSLWKRSLTSNQTMSENST